MDLPLWARIGVGIGLAAMFAYMTTLAWIVSFVVYQGGKLLGFG